MDEFLTINDSSVMEIKKYRVEIICSQALEEDFSEEFKVTMLLKCLQKLMM